MSKKRICLVAGGSVLAFFVLSRFYSANNCHNSEQAENVISESTPKPVRESSSNPSRDRFPTLPEEINADAVLLEEAMDATSELRELLDEDREQDALVIARSLVTHPNKEVRVIVVESLGWIGTPAVMDLVSFFVDSDTEVRETSEEAFWDIINDIDDAGLKIKLLTSSLEKSSADLRMGVLDEMLTLPLRQAFAPMANMLDDPNADIRELAADNLEFLSEQRFTSMAQAMEWAAENQAAFSENQ